MSFDIADFDPARPMTIDPPVSWATYYGGNNEDIFFSVDDDADGNVIAVGYSQSTDFPVHSAFQSTSGSANDIVIVKFDINGIRQWSTYFGGAGDDIAFDVSCGTGTDIAFTGYTTSSNFPVTNAHQSAYAAAGDAYLAYMNGSGVLQWSTFYGGNKYDEGMGVVIANNGDVFVGGLALSTNNVGTSGTHAPNHFSSNTFDGFIAKFNSN